MGQKKLNANLKAHPMLLLKRPRISRMLFKVFRMSLRTRKKYVKAGQENYIPQLISLRRNKSPLLSPLES
tara:strand:+ start:432 stop:641 length:210 start_codon:yes stop_codon:yes gene_type:complete